ncbi:MAG: hypothetical protein FWC73_06515 [Defluviitaleaceae bacterium]|nr:hypothetical protein [Defluviitaleaceae bacterium]
MKVYKSLFYLIICLSILILFSACGDGPPIEGATVPAHTDVNEPDRTDGPVTVPDAGINVAIEFVNPSSVGMATALDTRLFVAAQPSMIGFVDYLRVTDFETLTTRIINDLYELSTNIYFYRVDLDIPLADMQIHSRANFLAEFGRPEFFTYRELNNHQRESLHRQLGISVEGSLSGWYGLDEVLYALETGEGYEGTIHAPQQRILDAMAQGLPPSSTGHVISHFDPGYLNVLITDFYDFRGNNPRVFAELANQFFNQGLAVGVIAVRSGFAGDLPDFRRPGESITMGAIPSWLNPGGHDGRIGHELRPYYILLAGQYEDVAGIIHSFTDTLVLTFGEDRYRHVNYDMVLYYGLFADSTFALHGTGVTLGGNMRQAAFNQDEGTYELSVTNRQQQSNTLTVSMIYEQNPVLDTRSLGLENFNITYSLTEIGNGAPNTDVVSDNRFDGGNILTLDFEFAHVPPGKYILEARVEITPPSGRAFNNLMRTQYSNLSNWSEFIAPGRLFDLIDRRLPIAIENNSYLIDFPDDEFRFNQTIGLEEFTQSLEAAALASMVPIELVVIRFVIEVH